MRWLLGRTSVSLRDLPLCYMSCFLCRYLPIHGVRHDAFSYVIDWYDIDWKRRSLWHCFTAHLGNHRMAATRTIWLLSSITALEPNVSLTKEDIFCRQPFLDKHIELVYILLRAIPDTIRLSFWYILKLHVR